MSRLRRSVDGQRCNCSPEELTAYAAQVLHIQPREVHIYSIDRPVLNTKITLVPPDKLKQMAAELAEATGVRFRPFFAQVE